MKTQLLALLAIFGTSQICSSATLWSTGEPQAATTLGMTRTVWQYVSGYQEAARPQVYAAAPFRLDHDSTITKIVGSYTNIDPDGVSATHPNDVSYIVWARNGLAAPTSIVKEGSFGPYVAGTQYQGADVHFSNDFIHEHHVDFLLPAGDYYLTLYSKDTTINWVTGGQQPDGSLEQNFIWRSRTFPTPGFVEYTIPYPTDLLSDSKDVYNPIFSIIGVPEPSSAALFSVSILATRSFAWKRRSRGRLRETVIGF